MSRSAGRRVKPLPLDALQRWHETYIDDQTLADGDENGKFHASPFPFNDGLNAKLVIHYGDPCALPVDVLVNPSNERLSDRSGPTQRVYALAVRPTTSRHTFVQFIHVASDFRAHIRIFSHNSPHHHLHTHTKKKHVRENALGFFSGYEGRGRKHLTGWHFAVGKVFFPAQ